jgi:nicotinamidase-related amidase
MKKITIVIDMQNDFLTGALANPDAVNIIPSVLEQIKSADYVMYTRDTHSENYLETQEGKNLPVPHCVIGTHGWQIVDELDPNNIADIKMWHIVNKPTFGYVNIWMDMYFEDLVNWNGEDVEVTFCGTCTDICVVSNAMIVKSLYPELVVNVKADACAGLTPEKHQSALDVMSSCQINII